MLAYFLGVAKLPCSLAYLTLRLLSKKETISTALQRLGWSSIERRNGPVIWFNVNGLGETSTFLPMVYRCLQEYNENVTVLVTTRCLEVYKLLGESLPHRVLVQLLPLDNPFTISAFLRKWRPQIGVFLETPFHRELALIARESGVRLALLNAHIPGEEMLQWHARHTSRDMLKQTLSLYSLIVPRTYVDVGRFRMFGATLGQMPGWSTDLQQASELGACAARLLSQRPKIRRSLLMRLRERPLWVAANTLPGEDVVVCRIHAALRSRHKGLLTVVAPRASSSDRAEPSCNSNGTYAAAVRRLSMERRLHVELLSTVHENPSRMSAEVDMLVLDDPDALTPLYSLSEIVLVGGSLLPSLDGASSPAAAAVAGCALLMGPHGAEFLGLASDLNHAAIMASEEVAAAVAQTGATVRGIPHAGLETPREVEGQVPGPPQAPTVSPWLGGPRVVPTQGEVEARAVDNGSTPVSYGRSWHRCADVQGSVHTGRPMSAPPTAPEHFNLRPFTPPYTLSPFGVLPTDSSLQVGLSGPRNISIAPFSTPGMAYSGGGAGWTSEADATAPRYSSEFPAPPTGSIYTGSAKRRREIDRFRWVCSRDIMGFGYTSERDLENSESASITSDSDEEGLEAKARQGSPFFDSVAKRDCGARTRAATLEAATMPGAAPSSSRLSNEQSHWGMSDKPVDTASSGYSQGEAVASDCDEGDFHDAMDVGEGDIDPEQPAGEFAVSRAAGEGRGDLPQSPRGAPHSSAGEAIVEGVMLGGEAPILSSIDNYRYVATLMQQEQAQAIESEQKVNDEGEATVKGQMDAAVRTDNVDEAMSARRREAPSETLAALLDAVLPIGIADAWTEEFEARYSPTVISRTYELPVHHRLLLQNMLRSWKLLVQRPDRGGEDESLIGISVATSCGNGKENRLLGPDELPSQGETHQHGNINMDRKLDTGDDEAEWSSRQIHPGARQRVSDPGLSTGTILAPSGERRGFSLEWPGPSVKSFTDPAQLCLNQADNSNSALSLQGPPHSDPGQTSQGAHTEPVVAKGLYHVHGASEDITLMDTWTSDVSMAAMIETNDGGSSGELTPLSLRSPCSSATATREASVAFGDSPQTSVRGSLDHYLLGLSQQDNLGSSSPTVVRDRVGRGCGLTRMSLRTAVETDISGGLIGLPNPTNSQSDMAAAEDDQGGSQAPDDADDIHSHAYVRMEGMAEDTASTLKPGAVSTDGECAISASMEASDGGGSSTPCPPVVSAAVASAADLLDGDGVGSASPTKIAPVSSGGSHDVATTSATSSGSHGMIDLHAPCAAESPKSDFEFGGSVPDDTGSGSPTLLTSASVHNGSVANLLTYIATENTADTAIQQSDAISPLNNALAGHARPGSRITSPSSNNSWSDPSIGPSPPHVTPAVAVTRFQSSRQPGITGSNPSDSNPYDAGSCFAGEMHFKSFAKGSSSPAVAITSSRSLSASPSSSGAEGCGLRAVATSLSGLPAARRTSVSSTISAASTSSRSSSDLPGFHQVASIGSWLDHLGSMLPQPSLGLQRSQAQHDPMVWFSQQMAQHDASDGFRDTAVTLKGVAPGLRAPMHSPLRALDDDRHLGINPMALASVITTLFPTVHPATGNPAPLQLPAASPRAQSRVNRGAAVVASSSPLRSTSTVNNEEFTSASMLGRTQYAPPTVASSTMSALVPPLPGAVVPGSRAAHAGGIAQNAMRDELSALLNSPRSPVSPVRVTRALSPAMDRKAKSVSQLVLPRSRVIHPGLKQPGALVWADTYPLQQRSSENNSGSVVDGETWTLPMAIPPINTPQRELQGQPSGTVGRVSPKSSPLRGTPRGPENVRLGADAQMAAALYDTGSIAAATRSCTAASCNSRQPESPHSTESSSCPNTLTSRAADNASSPFRNPETLRSPSHQLLSPSLPAGMTLGPGADDGRSLDEQFATAVRAVNMRSPARSVVVGPGHPSPYKSGFAPAIESWPSPGPGTAFRSLYLEEEEELAAGEGGEEEDHMPLSPRAKSHNILFSMQITKDDEREPSPVPNAPRDATFSGMAAASEFDQQLTLPIHTRPSMGSDSSTAMTLSNALSPFAVLELGRGEDFMLPLAEATTEGSGPWDLSPIPRKLVASALSPLGSMAAAGPSALCTGSAGGLCLKLDSMPTFGTSPSLGDTDVDDGSFAAAPASAYHHLNEVNRQPRITLSGGVLIVPAATSSSGAQRARSNLSYASTPRHEDQPEELRTEPSMGLPTISDGTTAASDETQRESPAPGSSGESTNSMTTNSPSNGTVGTGCLGAPDSRVYGAPGAAMAGHGSIGSLASSSTPGGCEDSPPRSPGERTSCPRSSCPSASPVKSFYSARSSPVPPGLGTEGPHSPPLPFMSVLPSQQPGGRRRSPQSPSSPPLLSSNGSASAQAVSGPSSPAATYVSPRAADPRASPIKAMTAVKRTPLHFGSQMTSCLLRLPQFPTTGGSAVDAFFTSSVTGPAAAGLARFGRSSVDPAPDRRLAGIVPCFADMAPVRTQPTIGISAARQVPVASPHQRASRQAERQPWPTGGSAGDVAYNEDEPVLATRASCPGGFVALLDRGLPPTPRSGRHDVPLSPSFVSGEQSHVLHTQRTQQQQMCDRARVESRNASASGTPRSARALFGPSQLPSSLPSTFGFMDVCVSPEDAPRSPRVATSPARISVFSQDTAAAANASTNRVSALESRLLQQARVMYLAGSAQDVLQPSPVPVLPVSPRAGAIMADQGKVTPEPPSPCWSQVSRRLFPEGISGGGAAAPSSTYRIGTPQRRSADQLDEVLTHMKVKVASPVSPQPRLPPPPVSPRLASGGKAISVASEILSRGMLQPSGGHRRSSTLPISLPMQRAQSHFGHKTSASGGQDMPSPEQVKDRYPGSIQVGASGSSFHSPGASAQRHHVRGLHAGGANHSMSVPVLPHLPPLPRLRNLPVVSPADQAAVVTRWPSMPLSEDPSYTGEAGPDASVDVVHRRLFRQSAPELLLVHGQPSDRSTGAAYLPTPGMPAMAEQDALVALESQFKAAEEEAPDLPIETRLPTPTAVHQASNNKYGLPAFDAATPGLAGDLALFLASSPQATRSNFASNQNAGHHVAPPSPRVLAAAVTAPTMTATRGLVTNAPMGDSGNYGDGNTVATLPRGPVDVKLQALCAPTPEASTSQSSGSSSGASQYCDIRAAQGNDGNMAVRCASRRIQEPSTYGRRAAQHAASVPGHPSHPSAHVEGSGPAAFTPGGTPAARNSPDESMGAAQSPDHEPFVVPWNRYMSQYLLPAAQVTSDPRVGPAVWIVSNEDELTAALSRLLHDTIERQSRGRAAAQGAAKLASSLVTTVWSVLEDVVIAPALQEYITSGVNQTAT